WQRAVLFGDADRLASCYASPPVHRVAMSSVARYGRPAIVRVSQLNVIPAGPDRAVATFRRHWQTRGPKARAGEDQERMTFVRIRDEWKISAEEQTKVMRSW